MKTTYFMMIAVVAIVTSLWSCEKDFDAAEPVVQESLSESKSDDRPRYVLDEFGYIPDSLECEESHLKNMCSFSETIRNARKLSEIPSYNFLFYTKYKRSYKHLKQPDPYSCSWTSYVILAGCFSNLEQCIYPVTKNQVWKVKAGAGGKYMSHLKSYASSKDYSYFSFCQPRVGSNRISAIKEMMIHLNENKSPFLVLSTRGTNGHYRIVLSIKWKGSESNSTVYYMDCADADRGDFYENTQSMRMVEFVDSMIELTNTYNILFFYPRG